jgi:hypothetical protein
LALRTFGEELNYREDVADLHDLSLGGNIVSGGSAAAVRTQLL